MKKTIGIVLISAYLLTGCRNSNNNNQPAIQSIDTSSIHVTPPPKDTSVKNGQVIVRYPNGIIKEKSYYLNGRRNGECISFYADGKMCSDDYFTDGLIDGLSTTFYENGNKRYEGNFVKGKPSGKWSFWDEKGKLTSTKQF